VQVRRTQLEAEQRRMDELKRQAESAKEVERSAKYQLALAREEERKMVRASAACRETLNHNLLPGHTLVWSNPCLASSRCCQPNYSSCMSSTAWYAAAWCCVMQDHPRPPSCLVHWCVADVPDCCVMVLHVGVVALQDIQQRAANKDHMLGLVNAERRATNDRKRIERELFDSLRRDKVDSIQKMQVGERERLGESTCLICWI